MREYQAAALVADRRAIAVADMNPADVEAVDGDGQADRASKKDESVVCSIALAMQSAQLDVEATNGWRDGHLKNMLLIGVGGGRGQWRAY